MRLFRSRLRRASLVGGAIVLAATAVPMVSARALPQAQGIRVEENQTVEQAYPAVPGQNPLPGLPEYRLVTPEDCKTMAHCDVVPLEVVVPPTLTESDEFFLAIELTWETQKIPASPELPVPIPGQTGPLVEETPVNDMDLYVWDDPQAAEPLEAAASAEIPEKLRLFKPTKGKYQIVVLNYLGPNQGYKLKVTYSPETIIPPFESLDPGFFEGPPVVAPPTAAPVIDEPDAEEPPVDLSADPEPVNDPAAPEAPAPPKVDLSPVPVDVDTDFEDFGDATFDQELASSASDVLREKRARVIAPPGPASAGSLIVWLVILPMAGLATAGFWFARRSSVILRLK